ncbi:MAG: tyrosine-type recombinase/integrase [Helicobacteraceae bacterium]|nr:tyrosine-type recombinase/integrase [Helicobacteraceae bacterium]
MGFKNKTAARERFTNALQTKSLSSDVKRWSDAFLLDRGSRGLSKRTLQNYSDVLGYLFDYAIERGEGITMSDIDSQFFFGFLAWRAYNANKFAQSSKSQYIKVIKALFNYIGDNNAERFDYARVLRGVSVKTPKRLPKGLVESEYDKLEKYLFGREYKKGDFLTPRNILIVKIFFYCGLRRQELLDLNLSDMSLIHYDGKEAYQISVIGKGDKERIVYIQKRLIEKEIKALESYDIKAFAVTSKGRRVHPRTIWRIVSDTLRSSGVNKKGVHILRHTYATKSIDKDVNIVTLQETMGHADIKTTMIYARSNAKKKLEAAFK